MAANLRLTVIGDTIKNQERPECASCGSPAHWIIGLERLTRTYCEPCLMDILLDAINFADRAHQDAA